jgi:hypothetical protein
VIAVDPNPLAHFWAWVEHFSGANDEGGPFYGWWSGIAGSFIAPNLAFGSVGLVALHHVNCGHKGCWHISRHKTKDGHALCRKHLKMPLAELNLHEIHEDHR